MTLVKTTATDGSPVEFIFKDPMQGGMKDVYWHPQRQYVVAFFRKPLDTTGRERIESIVGDYRKRIFGQAGGSYWKDLYCWPEKIVEYNGLTGLVVPKYGECYFFGQGTTLAGEEKQGKWFASAKNFNRSCPPEERGDLGGYLRVCLQLARSVRRLHTAGLAHSDLSYRNCLIDPKGGNACIIDIDGLVVPGKFLPDVVGTPDFIAPEVVATQHLPRDDKNKKLPQRTTDQHALAVLIYMYLFHRHPLRGDKIHYSADDDSFQEKMEMGEKALFIEHPHDKSNHRTKFNKNEEAFQPWIDPEKLPYTIYGSLLAKLFERSFIDGLHNPSARPSANDWEEALIKTMDLILPCSNSSCEKKWFVFNNLMNSKCPVCGSSFQGEFPVIDFYSTYGKATRSDNHRLVVTNDLSLYQWHSNRKVFPNEKITVAQLKRVGYFQFWKGKWILVNEALSGMKDKTTDRVIPIGQSIVLTDGLSILLTPSESGRIAHVKMVNG